MKIALKLKELNFWNGVFLSYHCEIYGHGVVDYLVNNISPNIKKFSVEECDITDEHIKILVSRCTKIKELRFSCPFSITNDSLTHIIDHLKPTLEKLELTAVGGIDYKKKFVLKLMPKLKSLNCMCYRWEVVHELREQLPDVSVNGYPPMATVCKMKKIKYDRFFYNQRSEYEVDNDIWPTFTSNLLNSHQK